MSISEQLKEYLEEYETTNTLRKIVDYIEVTEMAERTRLCPVCREIMKPGSYVVEKKDGTRGYANEILTYDGIGIVGKLVYCDKCGCIAVA